LAIHHRHVLTIIAACLVWLCVQGYLKPQPALADGPLPVVIKRIEINPFERGSIPVAIRGGFVNIESGHVDVSGSVQIDGQPVDVHITE
jgi:hypothetical protein